MKKIIIHAGTHKTGSTSLQHFLNANRQMLDELGIFFPENSQYCEDPNTKKFIRHIFLHDHLKNKRLSNSAKMIMASSSGKNILLSDEGLYLLLFCKRDKSIFQSLSEAFAGYQVEINLYLRRQDLWLNSYYQQVIKAGTHPQLLGKPQKFIANMVKERNALDHKGNIEWFTEQFPGTKLNVRLYEKGLLAGGDICVDFFKHILGHEIPSPGIKTQQSLAPLQSYLVSQALRDHFSKPKHRRALKATSNFSTTEIETSILPLNSLASVVESHHKDNIYLCNKFEWPLSSQFASNTAAFNQYIGNRPYVSDMASAFSELLSIKFDKKK